MKRIAFFALPAALVAQAPATPAANPLAAFQKEAPAVEQLLSALQYAEAQQKAESLLPAEVAPFDGSNFSAAYNSYLRLWATSRLYTLAGKAAQSAGQWEKALEHYKKAVEIGKGNATSTAEHLGKGIQAYKDDIQVKKGQLEGNADYIKELRAKTNPNADDKQQLESVKGWEEGIVTNEKWMANFQKAIDHAKADAASIEPYVTSVEKQIADQIDQLDKYKFKNDKVKFVEGVVSSKPYMDQIRSMGKPDQAAFFYRLAVLDPSNKRVQREIDTLAGKAVAAEPAPKGKKK